MSVPPPRYHTVKYAGVLASASPLRSRFAPAAPAFLPAAQDDDDELPAAPRRRGTYRPWAELLKRTFDFDVLSCPSCGGRMTLLALVTAPKSIARYLRAAGEPTEYLDALRAANRPSSSHCDEDALLSFSHRPVQVPGRRPSFPSVLV